MASTFIDAMQTADVLTENGMPTNSTSGSAVVDLFFLQGAARQRTAATLLRAFAAAYAEDPQLALRALFYNRDIREGQGERRSFRTMFRWLCDTHPDVAKAQLVHVPFYGRWDDLFATIGTDVEAEAMGLYATALEAGDKLAAKWAPREGKARQAWANVLRVFLMMDWKDYRQLIASKSDTVERKMCAREWTAINYEHVPSQAAYRYRKAFRKRDAVRYQEYLNNLTKGTVKVNAKAVHPHELVREFMLAGYGTEVPELLEAQWKALPDWLPEGKRFIPISDVSGSMQGQPMEVSVALGMYLAERNVGPFKDALITFSKRPNFFVLKGTLIDRVCQIMSANWDMNTNIEAVFELILQKAKAAQIAPADMPQSVIILSDMQFDACIENHTDRALDMIDRLYQQAGYTRPNVVFWNLRASTGVPTKVLERGTALVSGFSPSIMKTVLTGTEVPEAPPPNPMEVMLNTLNTERYERITV